MIGKKLARERSDTPQDIIAFWRDAGVGAWFDKDPRFDTRFLERFFDAHMKAAARELDLWKNTSDGLLALLILLDQYPRNAFRGTAHMYATDALARVYARIAADPVIVRNIEPALRLFVCLPFAHSETLADQDSSVELMRAWAPEWLENAEEHRAIVKRFGRFPHRNGIFLRASTIEEKQFLASGGYAG